MEVVALWGGKGKNKGKYKNKGKNKDKDKNKVAKGGKYDKSGKGNKGGKDKSEPFEGYCSNPSCGRWGHRWKDCRKPGGGAHRDTPGANAQANAVEPANGAAKPPALCNGPVHAVEIGTNAVDEQFWDAHDDDDLWILMIEGEDIDKENQCDSGDMVMLEDRFDWIPLEIHSVEKSYVEKVMIDSSTFAHECNPSFAPHFPIRENSSTRGAVTASNTSLDFMGMKLVPGWCKTREGASIKVHIDFLSLIHI